MYNISLLIIFYRVKPPPDVFYDPCLVQINESSLFHLGGQDNRTFFYDGLSNNWTSGPNLTYNNSGYGCAAGNGS